MTSLKGNLNSVDLANIFQMLSLNQREGTLYIFEGASRKAIWFGRDGVSILSKGRSKSDSLGRILLRYDRITAEQLAEALQKRQESGRLLGQVLVEEGVCSRADVEEALQIQIQEEVYSLFIWKDAQFEFVEGDPDDEFLSEGVQKLTFNVNSLIMEAAKRVDEWEWIQSVVPDAQEVFRYTGTNVDLADSIFQESYSSKVLAAIDGRRSVEEIIEASYVNRFEVCKICAILIEGGAIEKLPVPDLRREAEAAVTSGDTDAAVKFLSRLVAVKGDTPQMHKQLAEAFEADRELEKAAFHYRVYAEILADQHDVKGAFGVYRRICEFLPTDLAATDRMVELFAVNPDGIEEHAKDIIERGKQLAEIYVELKRSSRAVQVLHRVVSLLPEDTDLRSRLIQVYLSSGMSGEAVTEYEALADAAIAAKDFEGAERIYRKILTIDRNRQDASLRLNQIVSKKKRRAQNIRNLVVGGVLLALAAGGGWYGWGVYREKRTQEIAREQSSAKRLQEVRDAAAPVATELDVLLKSMTNSRPLDLANLAKALKDERPRVADVEKRANAVVAQFTELRAEFAGMPVDEEAVFAMNDFGAKLATLKRKVAETQKTLRDNADALVEQAHIAVVNLDPTPTIVAKLDLARKIAEDCDGWSTSEKGQACDELRTQFLDHIRRFDVARKDVEDRLAGNDVDGAQRVALEYITNKNFPPADLRDQMQYPLRISSKPSGARVTTRDGEDTGLVTPCVVRYTVTKGAAWDVDLPGFATAHVDIAGQKDPAEIALRTPKVSEVLLEKKLAFRKATSDGRPVNAAPMASPRLIVVPSSGKSCDLIDPQKGQIVGSLQTNSSSPVKASGVIWQRADGATTVVLPTAEGVLMFFDGESGRPLGKWDESHGGVTTDLVLAGDCVLVADDRSHLHLVNIASRRRVWDYVAASPTGETTRFSTEPVVSGGQVFIGCENGTVHAVDLAGPREVVEVGGTKERFASIISPPIGDPGRISAPVTVSQGCAYILSRSGKETRLVKWNLAAGRMEWNGSMNGEVRSPPMIYDGTVFCVSTAAEIAGFRVQDGTRTHTSLVTPSVKVLSEAVIDGPVLYVGCSNGVLYGMDVRGKDVEPLWRFRIPMNGSKQPEITTRCVLSGGLILFGASDCALYALEVGN